MGTVDSIEEAVERRRRHDRALARRRAGFKDWTVAEFGEVWCVTDYMRAEATSNQHNRQMVRAFVRDFGSMSLREAAERPELARLWTFGGTARPDCESVAVRWHGVVRDDKGRVVVPGHVTNVRVVKVMFRDARKDKLVDANVWAELELPSRRGRQDIDPLEVAQVAALLEAADALYPDLPDVAALIATAAYTGMRLGELLGLRWDDLDFAAFRVNVRRQHRGKTGDEALPKYGSVRRIVLPPPAADRLRPLPRHLDGYVFHARRGRRMKIYSHHFYWDRVRIAAGMPRLAFHELRHFAGSYLAEKRATPRDIAHQFGHKDGGRLAERLYCHTYRENANDRIASIFGV